MTEPLDPDVLALLDSIALLDADTLAIVEQGAKQLAADYRELLGDPPELTPETMAAIDAEIDEICPPDLPQE